jgi:uncharacterized protein YbcV (DUF1398 family)
MSFTIEQIHEAHGKVKSGADFPKYIEEIKLLGVMSYETSVFDGYTNYFGSDNYRVTTSPKHSPLHISDKEDVEQFKNDLKAHQEGKTDYLTFINDCAKSGIEKWKVCMEKMTCTYYNQNGRDVLTEDIPN